MWPSEYSQHVYDWQKKSGLEEIIEVILTGLYGFILLLENHFLFTVFTEPARLLDDTVFWFGSCQGRYFIGVWLLWKLAP